ncbi:hypothetical protein AVEN_212629-1 [Araneus ventricosus]|uniref:Uncharacterized protein n=1 Tax=Araneus ventricosus TaxID=182803 RepID=A0A4Y2LKQ5_ARAVE|nr:hypothetical protein AVEN_212629-1 [Araneus ventricosus]
MAALSLLTNDRLVGPPPPRALRQPNSLSSRAQALFAPALPPYLWSKRETVSLSGFNHNLKPCKIKNSKPTVDVGHGHGPADRIIVLHSPGRLCRRGQINKSPYGVENHRVISAPSTSSDQTKWMTSRSSYFVHFASDEGVFILHQNDEK